MNLTAKAQTFTFIWQQFLSNLDCNRVTYFYQKWTGRTWGGSCPYMSKPESVVLWCVPIAAYCTTFPIYITDPLEWLNTREWIHKRWRILVFALKHERRSEHPPDFGGFEDVFRIDCEDSADSMLCDVPFEKEFNERVLLISPWHNWLGSFNSISF